MRKKIIICALSVLLLILSGVLAFYLHGQNRPIAGLSGDNRTLLRVWMLRTPGGAARWVETQLSAYEKQHPGVLIYLRQVSADELTAEESLLPDVVLYRPGDITDPDGLFQKYTGDSPYAYVMAMRIKKAKYLLRSTELTITAVAYETGFNSEANFIYVFTKNVGVSPGKFRKLKNENTV